MLQHINIKNFAIIDNLDLELPAGMTVITGETGAGKSIMIDALDVALGDRADSKMVRHGCDKCEINLSFDVTHIEQARRWLEQHELGEDSHECVIRRVTSKEGRSRNFINGSSVTLQQLKELGELLVHVHGQHQHHAMLKREQQRILLDNYLQQPALLSIVAKCYQQWKHTQQDIETLEQQTGNDDAQVTLLQYQVDELETLQLVDKEIEQLHAEQKQLANAESILQTCHDAVNCLSENPDDSVTQQLNVAINQLSQLDLEAAQSAKNLLNNALIEVDEAAAELKHLHQSVEVNDERLNWVEKRLETIHDLARKHKVKPDALCHHHAQLQQQLEAILNADERLQHARALQQQYLEAYEKHASKLSQHRQKAAEKLGKLVTKSLQSLGMPKGQFAIEFSKTTQPMVTGNDVIDFMVCANPGQAMQLLSKVASGGELSRVSLAIQVITAASQTTPTLVFDEVDVGIGGGTAEIVGQLLRTLGESSQVLCITHLPQVAAQGHHHIQISKLPEEDDTISQLKWLTDDERVQELARMLGGVKITKSTLAHAKEMLGLVEVES